MSVDCSVNTIPFLDEDESLRLLLTKGVCGHCHLEGGHITEKIVETLHEVEKLYEDNPHLAERFAKLTKRSYKEVLSWAEHFMDDAKKRDTLDFVDDFLTSLFVMKLGEASSPEIIRKLTRLQLTHELSLHSGMSIEVYPLVWIEMGLDYDKCVEAFVLGVEDALDEYVVRGPLKIGVSAKRKHLVERVDANENEFLSNYEKPYLRYFDLISALKKSSCSGRFEIFANISDIACNSPLFSWAGCPNREVYVKEFLQKVQELDLKLFLHMLEEVHQNPILPEGKWATFELDYMMEQLEKMDFRNVRLIHMAYWPQELPYLQSMKDRNFEIAVCQTSTRKLGASHKPRSPFLLKNPEVINGHIFDDNFVRLILSTDDSGPLGITDSWEELEVVYDNLCDWYGGERAALSFMQFLRNDYENMSPDRISQLYGINSNTVSWVMAYDIFEKKAELKDKEVVKKVVDRVGEILERRIEYTSQKAFL